MMARRSRFGFFATGAFALMVFLYLTMAGSGAPAAAPLAAKASKAVPETTTTTTTATTAAKAAAAGAADTTHHDAAKLAVPALPADLLTGGVIAPKLGNETAKQELGRASWRLLHTMMARFPEKPTADESLALQTYVQLFARLYPCGECAAHFQALLAQYPPQTSGRNVAAGWACFVHNEVNTRLGKPLFDCNNLGDFYDCGCGDEDKEKAGGKGEKGEKDGKTGKTSKTGKDAEAVLGGRGAEPIALEKEDGLSRGG